MAQQTINVGASPNDGTGTPLRTAFQYTNSNFSELYTALGGGSGLPGTSGQVLFNNGTNIAGDAGLVYNSTTDALTIGGNVQAASATITGDLTVDTNTLKVDSANNRVGIGTASPGKRCEINQSANTFTTIGEGEILRLIGDDGNTVGRITEIGFGTGPTSAVYAPVVLGAINTSNAGYNHKAFYIATRTSTADIAPVERYRIANDGVATWSNVGGGAGTAMTLNATGLGVGTSPSYKLDVQGNVAGAVYGSISNANTGGSGSARLRVFNSGDVSDGFAIINNYGASGQVNLLNYKASSLALWTNSLERLTIDSSGNVGIGVTPSAWRSGARALQLGTNGYATLHEQSNGSTNLCFAAYEGSANVFNYRTTGDLPSRYAMLSGTHQWFTAPSGTAGNAITFTQAMTLDASGTLLVGTASAGASGFRCYLSTDSGTTKWSVGPYVSATNFAIVASGSAGGVYLNGTTATSWTALSDERFKDIIEPISNAVAKVGSLRAVIGKIKGDETNTRKSFLMAQDVQSVLPEAVDASNPDRLGLAYTDVIPLLVAAIKELTARVQTLETR